MKAYIAFDDTDTKDADRGTGKLVRRFEQHLPSGCRLSGVVRQQLLLHDDIPYTSHNSSACAVVVMNDSALKDELIKRAIRYLEQEALPGSDPGLCCACEGEAVLERLAEFGRACTARVVGQDDALSAARGAHLSGHGGTNDGIIGAAAGVGLTAAGWSGRYIECGGLRQFSDPVGVCELEQAGIRVVSVDRDACLPAAADRVATGNWLRPRLWGGMPVLPVRPTGPGAWKSLGEKNRKQHTNGGNNHER